MLPLFAQDRLSRETPMKYRAVLFDLDGTLLDTLDDLADSMNAALNRFRFPTHPVDAYRYFVGDGMATMATRVLPETHRDPQTVERVVDAMRAQYSDHWADKTHPYEGVTQMLEQLQGRGIAMGVLSNKPDDSTKLMVKRLLPNASFEVVRGALPDVPLKPDPTAPIEIADAMSVSPQQFLYLGDTATDMQTARSAGMYPIGAVWGFRTPDELTSHGVQSLIDSPLQLLDLL